MLFLPLVTLFGAAAAGRGVAKRDNSSLIVTKVPDYVRPYAVRAYSLDGVRIGSQIYRFPVTGPSSDNAFTLISTAAPGSSDLGVLPHVSLAPKPVHQRSLITKSDPQSSLRELLQPEGKICAVGIKG